MNHAIRENLSIPKFREKKSSLAYKAIGGAILASSAAISIVVVQDRVPVEKLGHIKPRESGGYVRLNVTDISHRHANRSSGTKNGEGLNWAVPHLVGGLLSVMLAVPVAVFGLFLKLDWAISAASVGSFLGFLSLAITISSMKRYRDAET